MDDNIRVIDYDYAYFEKNATAIDNDYNDAKVCNRLQPMTIIDHHYPDTVNRSTGTQTNANTNAKGPSQQTSDIK